MSIVSICVHLHVQYILWQAIEEADVQEADETVAVCGDMKMVEVLHSNPGLIPKLVCILHSIYLCIYLFIHTYHL